MKFKLILLQMLLVTIVFGQSKAVWIDKGDQFFDKQDYSNAMHMYQKAMDDSTAMLTAVLPYEIQLTNLKFGTQKKAVKINSNDYARHQIAMCQMYTYDYKRAEEHLEMTMEIPVYYSDRFYYANALKNNGKFQQAIDEYDQVIAGNYVSDSIKLLAQIAKAGCEYGKSEGKIRPGVEVTLMDSTFNTGTSSFAVQYFGSEDRVMFTAAKPGGVILTPDQKSEFLCDVYYMEKQDGEWKQAINFGRPFNSAQHDAAATFNGGNALFYTRWSDVNRKEKSIFLARMIDYKFFDAYKLDERVNVPGYSSMQPFVTKDGKKLYFSSDRPGGKGGYDIWEIELDKEGNLIGEAKNLADVVNTPADEVAPFLHEKYSTFYFSSNGLNSMGGFDIFKIEFNREAKTFIPAENLGEPINSTKDDLYFIMDDNLDYGFLSSDREDCEFGHCLKIYSVKNGRLIVEVEGVTYDNKTGLPLPNTTILMKDVIGSLENRTFETDENGYYCQKIDVSQEWFMKASKKGFFNDANVITTKSVTNSTRLKMDFRLMHIPTDDIRIEGIEYDYNSANLRPEAKEVLDKLYDFLVLNDQLILELNSHTDARGSDKYNLELSQRRAQSCVNYLVEKGIDPAKLKAKGYGESKPTFYQIDQEPVLDNKGNKIVLTEAYINQFKVSDKKKFEALHQYNRRTAIKILGDGKEYESSNQ